jgi:NAD(P)-dependent dehydrogenase (short-subunit alcohol dehydrogenase family)
MDLIDKVIVVTGSARLNYAAFALRLGGGQPSETVLTEIGSDQAELGAGQPRGERVAAAVITADAACEDVAENEFGQADLRCPNTGIATGTGIHVAGPVWEQSSSANVLPHVHLAQALPSTASRRNGHIAIMSSDAGLLELLHASNVADPDVWMPQ